MLRTKNAPFLSSKPIEGNAVPNTDEYPVLQGSIESKGAFFIRLKTDGYTLFTIDYKNVTSSPCFLKVNIALEMR